MFQVCNACLGQQAVDNASLTLEGAQQPRPFLSHCCSNEKRPRTVELFYICGIFHTVRDSVQYVTAIFPLYLVVLRGGRA